MFELGSTKGQIHDSDESYFFEMLKNTNDKNEKFHSPLEEVCAMKICQKCAVGRGLRISREPAVDNTRVLSGVARPAVYHPLDRIWLRRSLDEHSANIK